MLEQNLRPKRREAMEAIRDEEIPSLETRHKAFFEEEVSLVKECNLLGGDIGDYGDVLKDQSIDVLIEFIKRNSAIREQILSWRKAV